MKICLKTLSTNEIEVKPTYVLSPQDAAIFNESEISMSFSSFLWSRVWNNSFMSIRIINSLQEINNGKENGALHRKILIYWLMLTSFQFNNAQVKITVIQKPVN